MPLPGRTYRDLRLAFERGDDALVMSLAPGALASLERDERQRDFVPAVLLMGGTCLAQQEHYPAAIAWLEQGLARMPDTVSETEMGDGHFHHRLLAQLYLLVGRWDQATAYLQWLAQPEQPIQNRLAAARAQALMAANAGLFDNAFLLINAAADLARRSRSRQLEAIVEGDRALVVGQQGRLVEAVRFADAVATPLGAPGTSAEQRWANAQAAAVLTTLARLCASADDPLSAQRFLILAARPVASTGLRYWDAQLDLARSVLWREEGSLDAAEPPLRRAQRTFSDLATAPAVAQSRLEGARLAEARGLTRSAIEIYGAASRELTALRLPREQRSAAERLHALRDAQS